MKGRHVKGQQRLQPFGFRSQITKSLEYFPFSRRRSTKKKGQKTLKWFWTVLSHDVTGATTCFFKQVASRSISWVYVQEKSNIKCLFHISNHTSIWQEKCCRSWKIRFHHSTWIDFRDCQYTESLESTIYLQGFFFLHCQPSICLLNVFSSEKHWSRTVLSFLLSNHVIYF